MTGIGIGVGLAQWQPDDPNTKKVALKWIGLFGDMFLRALKAIVLPIVFVNVIISMVDMMDVGAAGGVGGTFCLQSIRPLVL
jgi:Na+/H+-dicarboxylate symporter